MSMEKVKKFAKDHKTEIICSGLIGVASFALGFAGFKVHKLYAINKFENSSENDWFFQLCKDFDVAVKGCNSYTLAKPEELWATFDKDGKLVDALKDADGDLINPKMLMVFGDRVEK